MICIQGKLTNKFRNFRIMLPSCETARQLKSRIALLSCVINITRLFPSSFNYVHRCDFLNRDFPCNIFLRSIFATINNKQTGLTGFVLIQLRTYCQI